MVEQTRREVGAELGEVIRQLGQLQSALAVAVGALRHQNADIDADIANLLQRNVGDGLQEQIEKLESLQRLLCSASPAPKLRRTQGLPERTQNAPTKAVRNPPRRPLGKRAKPRES